jgi:hypothetical protein
MPCCRDELCVPPPACQRLARPCFHARCFPNHTPTHPAAPPPRPRPVPWLRAPQSMLGPLRRLPEGPRHAPPSFRSRPAAAGFQVLRGPGGEGGIGARDIHAMRPCARLAELEKLRTGAGGASGVWAAGQRSGSVVACGRGANKVPATHLHPLALLLPPPPRPQTLAQQLLHKLLCKVATANPALIVVAAVIIVVIAAAGGGAAGSLTAADAGPAAAAATPAAAAWALLA